VKTGHSLIKQKLRETKAELAGEMSGHIFFKHRWYGFDDALYSSARLVEIVSHIAGPYSSLLARPADARIDARAAARLAPRR